MSDNTQHPKDYTPITRDQVAQLCMHAPGKAVLDALQELFANDSHLLLVDANERSITFRFAMYLQSHFPNWHVDCEYNRDSINPKRLNDLGLHPHDDDEEAKTVFPDVIVHRRGEPVNHLVVEFKKSTSKVDRDVDRNKLEAYKSQLNYEYALFLELGALNQANIVTVEWI